MGGGGEDLRRKNQSLQNKFATGLLLKGILTLFYMYRMFCQNVLPQVLHWLYNLFHIPLWENMCFLK